MAEFLDGRQVALCGGRRRKSKVNNKQKNKNRNHQTMHDVM